jgi:hypothetical protein
MFNVTIQFKFNGLYYKKNMTKHTIILIPVLLKKNLFKFLSY